MAFRLKKVQYLKSDKHILLQNENGPCPLLAAANALLLKGSISLPPESVRNGVASLDDVCNILAEQALQISKEDDDTHSFHLNELLTIFPSLQDGLDVNPKFTAGVTGVEYTKNLTSFEMLHIELVHGWLLDPQDVDMVSVIGGRTYNELIEVLIRGKEASAELDFLAQELSELKEKVKALKEIPPVDSLSESFELVASPDKSDAPEIVDSTTITEINAPSLHEETEKLALTTDIEGVAEAIPIPLPTNTLSSISTSEDLAALEKKLAEKLDLESELSQQATKGTLIDNFLETSSHQLTHYGLMELYNHLKEDSLAVFFRNNHFCTITKHGGVLYLLVTDLGYAAVPEIMWEKLDDIHGDTEYMTPGFIKSSLQSDLLPPTSTPSPETMLAQRSQQEYDFQVALRLSQERVPPTASQLEAEQSKLIAEATKASLMEYNGITVSNKAANSSAVTGTIVQLPRDEKPPSQLQRQEEADRIMAMNFQAQMDHPSPDEASMALARKLQQEEYARQENSRARVANRKATASSSEKANCIIS